MNSRIGAMQVRMMHGIASKKNRKIAAVFRTPLSIPRSILETVGSENKASLAAFKAKALSHFNKKDQASQQEEESEADLDVDTNKSESILLVNRGDIVKVRATTLFNYLIPHKIATPLPFVNGVQLTPDYFGMDTSSQYHAIKGREEAFSKFEQLVEETFDEKNSNLDKESAETVEPAN